MSDEHTPYETMYDEDDMPAGGGEPEAETEPETIEDLVDLETELPLPLNADPQPEPVVEAPVDETKPLIFVPAIDEGAKLNIRESPDGEVKTKVPADTLLYCIEDGIHWAWVEFVADDGEMMRGYAKKEFLVTANG